MRLLHRLRLDVRPRDPGEVTAHVDHADGPDGGERLQEVLRAGAPPSQWDADGLELVGQPPRAEPDVEPAVRHVVNRRERLGQDDRCVVRQVQHRDAESDRGGAPGEERQRRQRVVHRAVRGRQHVLSLVVDG